MTVLKPDIYRLIAKVIKDEGDSPELDKRIQSQHCLAQLMLVSKMMHDLCKYYLYDDITVSNANTLVQNLRGVCPKADHLNHVKTLRLYHSIEPVIDLPAYYHLLDQGDWSSADLNRWPNDHSALLGRATDDRDSADKLWQRPAALTMKQEIVTGDMIFAKMSEDRGLSKGNRDYEPPLLKDQAFANLTRIVMTGTGDQSWGRDRQDFNLDVDTVPPPNSQQYYCGMPHALDHRPLPHFLISLPTLEHYCQTCQGGPLALAEHIIMLPNQPKTVTYHLHQKLLSSSWPMYLPPVVLGSVNRYIFDSPLCLVTDILPTATEMMDEMHREAFDTIQMLFCSQPEVLLLYPSGFDFFLSFDDEEHCRLDSTTIELYGAIEYLYLDLTKVRIDTFQIPKPSDLSHIEGLLNEGLGRWKGKVSLKNQRDCPPCSACDMAGPSRGKCSM